MEEFEKNKKRNSAVAIICAKWWRKWQDYTSQTDDENFQS